MEYLAELDLATTGGLLFALGLALPLMRGLWRGNRKALAELADARYTLQPRLRLVKAERVAPREAFRKLWAQCLELGFASLGDFNEQRGALSLLRAARHEIWNVALVVTEDRHGAAAFAMFHMSPDGRISGAGSGLEPALAMPGLVWNAYSAVTPASLWSDLRTGAADAQALALDLCQVRLAFETLYAARMDAAIATPPSMAALQQRALARRARLTPVQLHAIHTIDYRRWLAQVHAAALDHFHREAGIDPAGWERIRPEVHVVHDTMHSSDIAALLSMHAPLPQLYKQFQRQGLRGIALYERLAQYLPAAQRRSRLGSVDAPLHAAIYGLSPEASAPEVSEYTWEAVNALGRKSYGTVFAHNVGDALHQLDAMGVDNVKVLNDPVIGTELKIIDDPRSAALASKSANVPLPLALASAVWAHRLTWGPALALLGWSIAAGIAYTVVGYLIFFYALAAVGWTVAFMLPVALYSLLQQACVYGQWQRAQTCFALLDTFNPLNAVSALKVLAEETKIMAGRGNVGGALGAWRQALKLKASPTEYTQGLMAIYSIAGDVPGMIGAQRRLLDHSPGNELLALDLALSLARYESAVEEPMQLIARIAPDQLSPLALGGYHYVRGLIHAEQQQHEFAIKQYGQAIDVLGDIDGDPLIQGIVAEIRGFAALALKASGRKHEAKSVWSSALPVVQADAMLKGLVARYESA